MKKAYKECAARGEEESGGDVCQSDVHETLHHIDVSRCHSKFEVVRLVAGKRTPRMLSTISNTLGSCSSLVPKG